MTTPTDWKARAMELADVYGEKREELGGELEKRRGAHDFEAVREARGKFADHLDTLPSHEVPADPVPDGEAYRRVVVLLLSWLWMEAQPEEFLDSWGPWVGKEMESMPDDLDIPAEIDAVVRALAATPPPPMSQEPAAPQEAEQVRKDAERSQHDADSRELRSLCAQRDHHRKDAERLRAALAGVTDLYCRLINSGDAGNWDPEKEPEVIAARAALQGSEVPWHPV